MKKIYKKLTKEQKERNVVFSSCLSTCRKETDTIHEVFGCQVDGTCKTDGKEMIKRLLDDKFFNASHFKFNIIRK